MTHRSIHPTAERLMFAAKKLRKAEGPSDVARLLNVSPQKVTNWLSRGVSKEGMLDAQRLIGCNATWLQTGEGEMVDASTKHTLASHEAAKKRQNLRMIEGSKPALGSSIGNSKETFEANVEKIDGNWHRIPLISYAQAGMMTESTDPLSIWDRLEFVLTSEDVSPRAFGLRIKDLSCWPEYQEGDVVIIDPEIRPDPGNMVIAKGAEDEAIFGKYRPRGTNEQGEMVFELVPLNDDFATLNSERDHLRIIGVEIEHHRKKRRRQG